MIGLYTRFSEGLKEESIILQNLQQLQVGKLLFLLDASNIKYYHTSEKVENVKGALYALKINVNGA